MDVKHGQPIFAATLIVGPAQGNQGLRRRCRVRGKYLHVVDGGINHLAQVRRRFVLPHARREWCKQHSYEDDRKQSGGRVLAWSECH
jgi:hypothetical protein